MVTAPAIKRSVKNKAAFSRILKTAANDLGTPPAFTEISARNVADVWMALSTLEQTLATFTDWKCGIMSWQAAPVMQLMYAAISAPQMQPDDIVLCCGFQPYAWQYALQADMIDLANTYLGKSTPTNIYHFSAEDIVNWLTHNPSYSNTIHIAVHIDTANGWDDVREIARAAATSSNAIAFYISTTEKIPAGTLIAENVAADWEICASAVQSAIEDVREEGLIRVIAATDEISAADFDHALMNAANYAPDVWQNLWAQNADDAERALWASCKSAVQTA